MNIGSWRRFLLRWLGAVPDDKESLLKYLRELRSGYLTSRDMELLEGVLLIGKWQIRDSMIQRNDIDSLSVQDDYHTALAVTREKEHSRYPVFEDDGEHVCGILMAKDLLRYVNKPDEFVMRKVMRPAIFQPPSKSLGVLLDEFRHHRTHMVVVRDEYGMSVGIITIEDVLERIVGEIEDEFDDEEDKAKTEAEDGSTIIKGTMSVEEFNATFGCSLPEDGSDTIAGWLAAEMGRLPEANTVFEEPDSKITFEVLEADDRRIYTLKITAADD